MLHRALTPEQMDAPDVRLGDLRESLRLIRRVNGWLGGTAAVLRRLQHWSKRWPRGASIRVLDLGTGSADIPLAIARWAQGAGHDVRITAVDRHAGALQLAREFLQQAGGSAATRIELVQADVLGLPFAPSSFDYVLASLMLHHLPDIQVLTVLKVMDNLSRRGMIWSDLLRNRWALAWSQALTLGLPAMAKHDAVVSVRAGFTIREVLDIRRRLELEHLRLSTAWGYRFVLAGERTHA